MHTVEIVAAARQHVYGGRYAAGPLPAASWCPASALSRSLMNDVPGSQPTRPPTDLDGAVPRQRQRLHARVRGSQDPQRPEPHAAAWPRTFQTRFASASARSCAASKAASSSTDNGSGEVRPRVTARRCEAVRCDEVRSSALTDRAYYRPTTVTPARVGLSARRCRRSSRS
jgi:hypothetical protein